jgi:hypothetical protein
MKSMKLICKMKNMMIRERAHDEELSLISEKNKRMHVIRYMSSQSRFRMKSMKVIHKTENTMDKGFEQYEESRSIAAKKSKIPSILCESIQNQFQRNRGK